MGKTNNNSDVVCTIKTTGTVSSDYDYVGFSLSLSKWAITGQAALDSLKVNIKELETVITALKAEGLEVKNTNSSKMNVRVNVEYNNQTHKQVKNGYVATYNYSFGTYNVDLAGKVFESLVSVEDANVNEPKFELRKKNIDELKQAALLKAKSQLDVQLHTQSQLFDIDVNDLEVSNWYVNYLDEGSRNSASNYMGSPKFAPTEEVSLSAGKASVSVEITASYKFKE